jgi:poly(hydroxyalkanoate) granule-associated protein
MVAKKPVKNVKRIGNASVAATSTTAEETRRLWLACLGVVSLTRKHGGESIGRANGETRELALRTLQFARETLADTKAHATGVFAPIVAKIEMQLDACANLLEKSVNNTLTKLGIPTRRELDELSRHIVALNRKLKAAK